MVTERVLCPCNRCKRSILRQRRIANEHVEEWGEWDDSVVENQIREFEAIGRVDASLISPSYSQRSSLNASTSQSGSQSAQVLEEPQEDYDVTQEPLHDIDMEEMIEAFYEVFDGDEEDRNEHTEDPIIDRLRSLASTPLFEGSRASIL